MRSIRILLPLFTLFSLHGAVDNAHFYRANFFWGEPRFERPWLTNFNFFISGGSATQGRNSCGNDTNALAIYGHQNMRHLAQNVPGLNPNNPLDAILIALDKLPENGCFGSMTAVGNFEFDEAIFDIQQTFNHGLFCEFNMPVRDLRINNLRYADCSPLNPSTSPNANSPEWRLFLNSFDAILKKFNLCTKSVKTHGLGDISFLLGLTTNYEGTTYLDFIDATIKAGVLFPTGKEKNEHLIFDIPTGYNKHWGFPLTFDASFGLWEWLTIGFNSGIIVLLDSKKELFMKTACIQNGPLKLARGCATVHPGAVWHLGAFLKLDHITKTISFLLGYSFNKKNDDQLTAFNQSLFPTDIINSDLLLKSWDMHTMHLIFDFDFAREGRRFHPDFNFYINIPVAGKRILNTTTGGLNAGLTIEWKF